MFDDLSTKKEEEKSEGEAVPPQVPEEKSEAPLGSLGNVPANLAPNPSPSLSKSEEAKPSAQLAQDQTKNEEFDQRMQKLEAKGKKRGSRFSKIGIIVGSVIALSMMAAGYYLLTEVIGITEQAQVSVGNIPNIGRENGDGASSRERITEEIEEKEELSEITQEMILCGVDLDCVETQEACCDCMNGGIQTAINKDYLQEWEDELNEKCAETGCLTVVNCSEGEVYCDVNENVCKYREVQEECKNAGEIFVDIADVEISCCEGLERQLPRSDMVAGECKTFEGEAVCINCGDEICSIGENECNCPIDCPSGGEEIEPIEQDCSDGSCPVDTTKDTDGDGIVDVDEELLGSNINNPDTDGDGLMDGEELVYGTEILNPDTDGDGYSDGSEVENGYNPTGEGMLNQ